MIVYLNGCYLEAADARVPVTDRGFLYGDALYENIRVYRGGFFRFGEHYRRLTEGAAALQIAPPSAELLRGVAGELALRNGTFDGALRVTLTRGPGGGGLSTRGAGPPTVLVTLASVEPERMRRAEEGWAVIVARARRAPSALPGSIKSANRLDAILAKLEAEATGADEAILLSVDGRVAEGTTCNVFWRSGEVLCTPSLDVGILPGVTRGVVLEIAVRRSWRVREARFPLEALKSAPEIFLTMTSVGPVHVRSLDGRAIPARAGELFARLRKEYWMLVEQEAREDPLPNAPGVERRTTPA